MDVMNNILTHSIVIVLMALTVNQSKGMVLGDTESKDSRTVAKAGADAIGSATALRQFRFYAYPLARNSLASMLSENQARQSFVTSMTGIPDLHNISVIEDNEKDTPISKKILFRCSGIRGDGAKIHTTFCRSILNSRSFPWHDDSTCIEPYLLEDYKRKTTDQSEKIDQHVYVTLYDVDWDKPFSLLQHHEPDCHFLSAELPNRGSETGVSLAYFIPSFCDVTTVGMGQKEKNWSEISEQDKWLYILKYGYLHIHTPPELKETFFERVFDRLDVEKWNFNQMKGYAYETLFKNNDFCCTLDAWDAGEEMRKRLMEEDAPSFEEKACQIWPKHYQKPLQLISPDALRFSNATKVEKTTREPHSLRFSYAREAFFMAKLSFTLNFASFVQGLFYSPSVE